MSVASLFPSSRSGGMDCNLSMMVRQTSETDSASGLYYQERLHTVGLKILRTLIITATIKYQILLIFLFPFANSLSQDWVKIIPKFSTGDTTYDISEGVFVSRDIGWVIPRYRDTTYIFKTTDGGYNWILQKRIDYLVHTTLFALDSLHCWALGSVGGIIFTTNGGDDWNISVTVPWTGSDFSALFFFNHLEGIIANQFRWFTADGGQNWTALDTSKILCATDMTFIGRKHGWIVCESNTWATDGGLIAASNDSGRTWELQGDTLFIPIMNAVWFVDTLIGFAVGTNVTFSTGFIYSTTDGGTIWSWKQILGGGVFSDVGFLNKDRGWISGYQGRDTGYQGLIWSTSDRGEHWTVYETGINVRLGNISVLPFENTVYVFGENNTLFRADLTTGVLHPSDKPLMFVLTQNYPNPFNLTSKIKYSIPFQSHVWLKIFDIQGRAITTLVDENKVAGEYEFNWNAEGLSSGVYFYQIAARPTATQTTTPTFVNVKKMILVR